MGRVIVTGAKGGTGPSIVSAFAAAGWDVLGLDLKPCAIWETGYRQVDLRDGASLYEICAGADAIVHFGSLPTDGWTSWHTAYENLALGGFHVLQAAARLGIRRLVLASSPEIYGDLMRVPYLPVDENSPAQPDSIYGAAKQNLETLAAHYARWYGIAIAALRPQRIVYEQSYEWRFRRFTGDPDAAVDALWSYVDARDVASACLAWIESDLSGCEVFNVAADDVCVDVPTAQLLAEHLPQIRDVRGVLEDRNGLIDCAKLKSMLGWQPQHHWQQMARESEQCDFPHEPPVR